MTDYNKGMMIKTLRRLSLGFLLFLICACSIINPPTPVPTLTPTASDTPTPAPSATPTPLPAAITVNGIGIAREDFETVLENFRLALTEINGTEPDPESLKERALNWVVEEALFEKAASENGIVIPDDEIEKRMDLAIQSTGGIENFSAWLQANHYTQEGFRRALQREAAVAAMRQLLIDQSLAGVEQVYAYMIRTDSHGEANSIKTKLDMGLNFVQLAKSNDPITGGDLDWVARGVMVDPVLEEALFSLQPGTYTDIIETENGFFLLYAAQKSTDQPLSIQTRQILEQKLLRNWVDEQKAHAEITLTDLY